MAGEIVLHLGSHKTASTHLQLALKRARPVAGAAVFVPDDLRKDGLRLQDWLGLPGDDPGHAARLRAAFDRPGRLVLSEENILGQVPGPGLARGLYPQAAARLARLDRVLPPGRVTLALAVREGAGFLAACHAQALMAGRVAPFDAAFGGVDPAGLDWAGLAARLAGALPRERAVRLVVWDHADWPAVAPQVAQVLLGGGGLRLPPGLAHPSLSAEGVARLLAEAPADPEVARARARALRAEYDRAAGHAAYDPLGPQARAAARAALARDLAAIAARPDATVLRVENPGPSG